MARCTLMDYAITARKTYGATRGLMKILSGDWPRRPVRVRLKAAVKFSRGSEQGICRAKKSD
jgi:hypothetical protein